MEVVRSSGEPTEAKSWRRLRESKIEVLFSQDRTANNRDFQTLHCNRAPRTKKYMPADNPPQNQVPPLSIPCPGSMLSLMRHVFPREIRTTTSTLHEGSRGAACALRISRPGVLKFCSRWFAFMLFPGAAFLSHLPQALAFPRTAILMRGTSILLSFYGSQARRHVLRRAQRVHKSRKARR